MKRNCSLVSLVLALFFSVSAKAQMVLFDSGPFCGHQSNTRNTAVDESSQRIFDDFTLHQHSLITGFEWLQHDRNDIQYYRTEIRIYRNLPVAANLIYTSSVIANRTPNTTGTIFEHWDGYDYSVTGLNNLRLSPGTYFLGLNTNSLVGDTSWDSTICSASTIPGRRVVNELNPEPGIVQAADSVFKVIGYEYKQVMIDIKPGSEPNTVNCTNLNEILTVAILSTDDFDATTVDHTTVQMASASEWHVSKKTGEPRRHEEDVDSDGDVDLVVHFRWGDTFPLLECAPGPQQVGIIGNTFDGFFIWGYDTVRNLHVVTIP